MTRAIKSGSQSGARPNFDTSGTKTVDKTEWQNGAEIASADLVIEEVPVALVYNGVSHVVMMATPTDLEDFALGFSLSEGILHSPAELLDSEIMVRENGIEVQLRILASRFAQLKQLRRNLTGRTGCGLCGAESLEQAIQLPAAVTAAEKITHRAIEAAVAAIARHQPLQHSTGSSHAAAWCDPDGNIVLLREDVGRHNALDKLLGVVARDRDSGTGNPHGGRGFVLVTSRASYEMVAKTARLDIPLLVSLSGPTSLAIATADACAVTLVGFSSPGRHVVYSGEVVSD